MSDARSMSVSVYSAADVPADALTGETVAVLGYGNLGRTATLNLRDSGVTCQETIPISRGPYVTGSAGAATSRSSRKLSRASTSPPVFNAALDNDRAARAALRRGGFTVAAAGGRRFVGDTASGELGGRLCAACHFDEYRLGLGAVRRANFCVGCHASREEHFPAATVEPTNRCVSCHVRVGESVTGQTAHTHRFALPGAENAAR